MGNVKKWSPELEGLRGIASLWVLLGHISLLTNFHIPIISDPKIGVDLFILLSGFLMAKNFRERKETEPWNEKNTIVKFWTRRLFRIAPVYYLLLIVAILFGPYFGEMRDVISSFYPNTATATSRYSDQSLNNIVYHLTFIFGFIPSYAFNTVLPDWSIGLEMQYYALLPFIMIIIMRFGYLKTTFFIMLLCVIISKITPSAFTSFDMPSMILFKLHLFIAGMLIYEATRRKDLYYLFYALLAPVASAFIHFQINKLRICAEFGLIIFIAAIVWDLQKDSILFKLCIIPKSILSSKISTFFGDVSYSVYLLHLLVITPVIALLLQKQGFHLLPGVVRYVIVVLSTVPVIYIVATFLFRYIEKPGMNAGKTIIKTFEASHAKTA